MRKPTFLLKPSAYKTDKLYSVKPNDGGGDMSVSSYLGNGTRVNKNGLIESVATDTPRIDYHKRVGLLLEPSRRNQATYSADVSNWTTKTTTNTYNDTIAPDGTLTADKISDTTDVVGQVSQHTNTVLDATLIHTASIFVKFGNTSSVQMVVDTAGSTFSLVNVRNNGTTDIASDTESRIVSHGSENYGDGWWRFYVVYDMLNTDTSITVGVYPGSDPDVIAYCWVWGLQLEQGNFMTSYIPTVATTVVRAYDSMTLSGIETAGFVSLSNGIVFIDGEFELQKSDTTANIFTLGTADGQIGINKLNTSSELYPRVRVLSTDTTADVYTMTQSRNKVAFVMTSTNVDVWINGSLVLATSKDFFLTADDLNFNGTGSSWKLIECAIFNQPMTTTELQALTR